MAWLPEGENVLMICLFVLTQLTNVTDRLTCRQTDTAWRQRPRLMLASRGKNASYRRIAGYRSMTAAVRTTTATVDGAVYRIKRHTSVNLCLSLRAWSNSTTMKRTEQNLIVRSPKSLIWLYAAVNMTRNLRSTYCTIEATNRHDASRGLRQQR